MVIRYWFYLYSFFALAAICLMSLMWPPALWLIVIAIPLIFIGLFDVFQQSRNVLRNYPVWGHWRYILLSLRPMIQQYFIATNLSDRPFNMEERDLVYERAAKTLDTLPFGTQRDVTAVGYEWMAHSLHPVEPDKESARLWVGNEQCKKPYLASRLNISAMSYGALSINGIRALNRGAKMGNFYHNTGEGGLSHHHLKEGGDIVWQIGTACFGCRTKDGKFDPVQFKEKAQLEQVKMIEIKLSQGAKPSHGGILPAAKITPEIAKIRGIEMGKDCISPPTHPSFSTPRGLMEYIAEVRELSGGKPVGFKLCLGQPNQFMGICKAIIETGIIPDFITIDGSEGGTGAAPVEFSNFIGTPLVEALTFIHNCLVGINVRDKVRIIASGKIISGFDIAAKIALGADMCNSARGMMFALGCIQSLRCNKNTCPTGVATQDPGRTFALNIADKAPKVHHFHDATIHSFMEVLGAAGLSTPDDLEPRHIYRRVSVTEIRHYDQIYKYLKPGQLLTQEELPPFYKAEWALASADEF